MSRSAAAGYTARDACWHVEPTAADATSTFLPCKPAGLKAAYWMVGHDAARHAHRAGLTDSRAEKLWSGTRMTGRIFRQMRTHGNIGKIPPYI